MRSYAPLMSTIVGSSLWDEPDWVMKVFLTMLVLKDTDDVYRGTAYQLAHEARKTEGEILEAWKKLSGPDPRRKQTQEFEGRRIRAVEDGWFLLNAAKYREESRKIARRAANARAQAAWRERQRLKQEVGIAAGCAGAGAQGAAARLAAMPESAAGANAAEQFQEQVQGQPEPDWPEGEPE